MTLHAVATIIPGKRHCREAIRFPHQLNTQRDTSRSRPGRELCPLKGPTPGRGVTSDVLRHRCARREAVGTRTSLSSPSEYAAGMYKGCSLLSSSSLPCLLDSAVAAAMAAATSPGCRIAPDVPVRWRIRLQRAAAHAARSAHWRVPMRLCPAAMGRLGRQLRAARPEKRLALAPQAHPCRYAPSGPQCCATAARVLGALRPSSLLPSASKCTRVCCLRTTF